MSFFLIIYGILSITLPILVYFFFLKKYPKSLEILYKKRKGIICSKCSQVLVEDYFTDRPEKIDFCLTCRRETILNKLLTFKRYLDSFDIFVLSIKSNYILLSLVFIGLPIIVISTIISVFESNNIYSEVTSLYSSSTILIYWIIAIYRLYLCRK